MGDRPHHHALIRSLMRSLMLSVCCSGFLQAVPGGLWPLLEVPPCGPAPLARPKLPTVRWAHLPDATVQCQCAMLPIEARWTSANSTEPEDSQTRSTALLNSGHICRGYIAVKNRYCNCFSWCNKEGWLHTAQDVMAHGSISCR